MPVSDDLPELFRSFASDEAATLAHEHAAVLRALQRWPLLRAISTIAAAPVAPLTDHERQAWHRSPRRQAMGRPGPAPADLGTLLARGLARMTTGPMREPDTRPMPIGPPSTEVLSTTAARDAPAAKPALRDGAGRR